MADDEYTISLEFGSESSRDRSTRALVDFLREISAVIEVKRSKTDDSTMDLGNVISVVVASGAATVFAQGLADWLRARRGAKIIIERKSTSVSLKAVIEGFDPEGGAAIIEKIGRD